MDLRDAQWDAIKSCFPVEELRRTTKKGGRPYVEVRAVLDGVLWVLRTGAPWADLPRRYPPYQTCHRRFQTWIEDKTLERLLRKLAEDLRDRGNLDLTEAYIDGSHAGAKGGPSCWEHSTRQSDQGHGGGRPLWSSSRRG
ncbi:MAG: transposase, partial [Kofleriaceae bacterium]